MTKDEAMSELESNMFHAIKESLSQDHEHVPYVKELHLKEVSVEDIKAVAKITAVELAKRTLPKMPRGQPAKPLPAKNDETKS